MHTLRNKEVSLFFLFLWSLIFGGIRKFNNLGWGWGFKLPTGNSQARTCLQIYLVQIKHVLAKRKIITEKQSDFTQWYLTHCNKKGKNVTSHLEMSQHI